MKANIYPCFFCIEKKFDTNFFHFRQTETVLKVVGICESCIDAYGAYSNTPDSPYESRFSFTDEYLANFPRLKEVSVFREKRGS